MKFIITLALVFLYILFVIYLIDKIAKMKNKSFIKMTGGVVGSLSISIFYIWAVIGIIGLMDGSHTKNNPTHSEPNISTRECSQSYGFKISNGAQDEKPCRDRQKDYGDYDNVEPYENDEHPGYHQVDGYYRSDGTYVEPYIRSNPDGVLSNNLSY